MSTIRILGISGSLRSGSHNTALLRAAALSLPSGAELEVYDGLRDLPAYDADLDTPENEPAAVARLRAAIEQVDGVLISTPEFNGSIPGALKNALDWASRPHGTAPLVAKPAAVISASTTAYGAKWAQEQVRRALTLSGAMVIDSELAVDRADRKILAGEVVDSATRAALTDVVAELAEAASAFDSQATAA